MFVKQLSYKTSQLIMFNLFSQTTKTGMFSLEVGIYTTFRRSKKLTLKYSWLFLPESQGVYSLQVAGTNHPLCFCQSRYLNVSSVWVSLISVKCIKFCFITLICHRIVGVLCRVSPSLEDPSFASTVAVAVESLPLQSSCRKWPCPIRCKIRRNVGLG